LIAFLGGTFDPVHLGHLHAARTVRDTLGCREVRLVLAALPSHRPPTVASSADRWAMLTLAVAGEAALVADRSELDRGTPSFTIDTLVAARAALGDGEPLAWIVGWDAYRLLPTWKRWWELADVAHLVVVHRPGETAPLDAEMTEFDRRHRTADVRDVTRRPSGCVLRLEAGMLPVSATDIRARRGRGEPVAHLLPASVWTYISHRHLYETEAPRLNVTTTPA
jgi:nicotinate-nucleotide adenylyltransferase